METTINPTTALLKSLRILVAIFFFFAIDGIKANSIDACVCIPHIDSMLPEISNKAPDIIKSEDSCVLILLDSLSWKFINSENDKYFIPLGSISNCSQGYVSEYFIELINKIYERKPFLMLTTLYNFHDKYPNIEDWFIINANSYLKGVSQKEKTLTAIEKIAGNQGQSTKANGYYSQLMKKIRNYN